jgi:MFS family permease
MMGRKNAMLIGTACMLISNTGLGMLALIPYTRPGWFYFCSLATRFLQGYGDTLATTTALSLISTNFSEDKAKYIGYMEAAGGLGLMIGPSVGSFLYGYLNYAWTFYFLSICIGINLILLAIYTPNKLNNTNEFSFDRTSLTKGFLISRQIIMPLSVNGRNQEVQNHNVKSILEHLTGEDSKNKQLI